MNTTYCFNQSLSPAGASAEDFSYLSAERDFMTPDGRLVPRALGEAALRQRTALLVGGLLVGFGPRSLSQHSILYACKHCLWAGFAICVVVFNVQYIRYIY